MGDMGDLFNAMRQATKEHRAAALAKADTAGWTKHTSWHFSRKFHGERIDWWPSGGKAKWRGKMICGHQRVNALIQSLKESCMETPKEKLPYVKPVLKTYGKVKDLTATGSGRTCPNGKPKPPTGNCGPFG